MPPLSLRNLRVRFGLTLARFVITIISLHCAGRGTVVPEQTTGDNRPLYTTLGLVADGLFTRGIEGPAVGPNGTLYAVNFSHQGTIGSVFPNGKAQLFLTLPPGSIGNGLRFDSRGRLYVADYVRHNILRYTPPDWRMEMFVHEPNMHQPNDLTISRKGTLYASDPNWANETGQIWRIDPMGKSVRIADRLGTTNGIALSPDDSTLYINESVQRRVWAFSLTSSGLTNKRLLHQFHDYGLDGMRCDVKGNVFVTRYGKGTVAMLSPDGKFLREISLTGKRPTNLAFGGPDGRTVYVTLADRGAIEVFRSAFPGRSWQLNQ